MIRELKLFTWRNEYNDILKYFQENVLSICETELQKQKVFTILDKVNENILSQKQFNLSVEYISANGKAYLQLIFLSKLHEDKEEFEVENMLIPYPEKTSA